MKVEYCQFLGRMDKTGRVVMRPLGRAKNRVKAPTLSGWKDVVTDLVIAKQYARGLDGIEGHSHVIVVYWMDREVECHLKHHPQGRADVPYLGVFSCRCPQRPNPIAISTVKLLSRKGNVLTVKGLDIVDGTPIIDVKPHWPQYDTVKKARVPAWVKKLVF